MDNGTAGRMAFTSRSQRLGRLLSPNLQPVVVVDQEDFWHEGAHTAWIGPADYYKSPGQHTLRDTTSDRWDENL